MHFKNYLLFLLLILSSVLYSQRETSNWFFGKNAGIRFDDTGITTLTDGMINTWEGCSSISDKNGNLLLYSDGLSVWNKFHKLIKNGSGLLGDYSSTQSALIINHPENDSLYYVITTPYAYSFNVGMRYNIININRNNDSGELILKNGVLHSNSAEKVNAVNHQNGKDIWVTGHEFGSNLFYSYLLTKNGFMKCPVTSENGFPFIDEKFICQGNIKFSSNGQYLVNTFLFDNSSDYYELFKFDNKSGKFIELQIFPDYPLPYGAEFSPDSKFLYIAGNNDLLQVDLTSYSIKTIIHSTKGKFINSLQIAKDGKIYCALLDSSKLGVIDFPDSLGSKCNFRINGPSLNGKKCQYGLPNFNQSYFYTPAINFKYELECINNTVQFLGYDTFNARVHQWEIRKLKGGNWQTIGQDKNIIYTFTDTGMYEVRYGAAINSRQDTVSKTIPIYPKINKHFLGKDTVYAKGTPFKKQLIAPYGMHCQLWQDSTGLSTYQADTAGRYTCKVTNQSFCEVTDTIEIKECINSLTVPSIYRIKDSLYTYQQVADSFIWFKNNVPFKITKAPAIKLTDTGTYRVEAAKKAHCNRSSANFRIEKLSLHKLNSQAIGIKIYPNPANEKVFIEASTDFRLLVTDATGKTILEAENIKEVTLANGIYYFRLTVNNTSYFEKVVVLN